MSQSVSISFHHCSMSVEADVELRASGAKRIGLLFSEAQVDYDLDPRYTADIPDIKSGDEIFSDGCGLISRRLAVLVSKKKKIILRGVRYTPCVFQIRCDHAFTLVSKECSRSNSHQNPFLSS